MAAGTSAAVPRNTAIPTAGNGTFTRPFRAMGHIARHAFHRLNSTGTSPMSISMEDPATAPLRASAASRALAARPRRRPASDQCVLEECVAEFTRRLQTSVALPEDDERFWERVRADIRELRSR